MACTKSELASAINSYASARATGDPNLLKFSADLVSQLVETLEFAPEAEPVPAPEETTEE